MWTSQRIAFEVYQDTAYADPDWEIQGLKLRVKAKEARVYLKDGTLLAAIPTDGLEAAYQGLARQSDFRDTPEFSDARKA